MWAAAPLLAGRLRPLLFWFSLALLNTLLFLPPFLLSKNGDSLLPALPAPWPQAARELFAWRDNLDPLRLSAELLLLIAAWVFLPALRAARRRRPLRALIAAFFFLAFTYAVYEALSLFFYNVDPVFYDQADLIREGLPFVARHLSLAPAHFIAAAALTLLALGGLLWLLKTVTAEAQISRLGPLSRGLLAALALFILASLLFNGRALAAPSSVVSCFSCKLERNIRGSAAAAGQVRRLNTAVSGEVFDDAYAYAEHRLARRPDIYLIFVESYGSILYRRPALRTPYLALLEELQQDLQGDGWQAATIMSESPTWGGGSWMAYTSALFGLRVDTHPAYLALLERFPRGGYPHLAHTLKRMGYTTARVTSLSVELEDAQWQQYKAFYGVDRWLRHSDLGYDGRHYGWGPAPPDQYVLSAANELLQDTPQPLFLFMITQNSHYPWQEVPPLAADWRALADGSDAAPQASLATPQVTADPANYLEAIAYEMRVLTRFIRQEVEDDALVILIGDHQPGYITGALDGNDTLLHIISGDEVLVSSLSAYGFEAGLALSDIQKNMKHEGLYSLLMRLLVTQYGSGDRPPPPYLPGGFVEDAGAAAP